MLGKHFRLNWCISHQQLLMILTHVKTTSHSRAYWKVINYIINRNSCRAYYFLNLGNIAEFLRLNCNEFQRFTPWIVS